MVINKIVLTGGGTMGSVSPLLAIYQELKKRNPAVSVIWIGTADGPEKKVVEDAGITFYAIPTGKFRRYFSFKNFTDPIHVIRGYFAAKKILKEFAPDMVLTAGSFVCVAVVRAAYKLGIPYTIHQQDIEKGMANKLMEKHSAFNTITFDASLADFDIKKTYYTSNPMRLDTTLCNPQTVRQSMGISSQLPVVLVMGGGLGASALNTLLLASLGSIAEFAQVVHLTGVGKSIRGNLKEYYSTEQQFLIRQRYFDREFATTEMCALLQLATVVVTRAGLSSLTELSLLKKPTVIVPIPDSHQEANAQYYAKYNAAVILNQKQTTPQEFTHIIQEIVINQSLAQNLSNNISQMIDPKASEKYVDLIEKYLLSRK